MAGGGTILGILGRAWGGAKTAWTWIGKNPWTSLAIVGGWALIRAIRRRRYEAGRMGPFEEKMYEIFSPLGDVGDYIAGAVAGAAISQLAWDALTDEAYQVLIAEPTGRMNRNLNRLLNDPVLDMIR